MSGFSALPGLACILGLMLLAIIGWPAIATVREATVAWSDRSGTQGPAGGSLDPTGSAELLRDTGTTGAAASTGDRDRRPGCRYSRSGSPLGVVVALFLFRTDVWGRRPLLALIGLSAFVPLPLACDRLAGRAGERRPRQAFGVRPILIGHFGAAVVHALATLPWVVLIVGVGFARSSPNWKSRRCSTYGPVGVLLKVTLRRAWGAIAAAALAVAVLTAGDMTVTDLLQIRTYAEEAYLQYSLGRGREVRRLSRFPHSLSSDY